MCAPLMPKEARARTGNGMPYLRDQSESDWGENGRCVRNSSMLTHALLTLSLDARSTPLASEMCRDFRAGGI